MAFIRLHKAKLLKWNSKLPHVFSQATLFFYAVLLVAIQQRCRCLVSSAEQLQGNIFNEIGCWPS
jgi:hypothetical protein